MHGRNESKGGVEGRKVLARMLALPVPKKQWCKQSGGASKAVLRHSTV
jgi:hypothetical protein